MQEINKFPSGNPGCETIGFRAGKEDFFVPARRARDCAETYNMYVAQTSLQIDDAGAEKDPFWTEIN